MEAMDIVRGLVPCIDQRLPCRRLPRTAVLAGPNGDLGLERGPKEGGLNIGQHEGLDM